MDRRTPESSLVYKEALKNGAVANFAERPAVQDFKNWKIIDNEYPYDAIAAVHHMLVPKKKIEDPLQLSQEELEEYLLIRRIFTKDYDVIWENTKTQKTVPEHYHVHLIKLK